MNLDSRHPRRLRKQEYPAWMPTPANIALITLLGATSAVQFAAMLVLPPLGDEPDDFAILFEDIGEASNFFADSVSPDQARLPFLVALPFVAAFPTAPLIPARVPFFGCHVLALAYAFRLARLVTEDVPAARAYVILVGTSCYMSSFAILAMTTGDTLYLLFHAMTLCAVLDSQHKMRLGLPFPGYVSLAGLLGCCIASKLFGVLLLGALIATDVLQRRWTIRVRSPNPARMVLAGAIFLGLVALVNGAPLRGTVKGVAVTIFGMIYVLTIMTWVARERSGAYGERRLGLLQFWSIVTLTSFALTVLLSPVYWYLPNLIRVTAWFEQWGAATGELVARSNIYDIAVILVLKLGVVSTVAVVAACISLVALFRRHDKRRVDSRAPFVLLGAVFVIHFIAVSVTSHKVTWYPLAIFPLLFLPVVLLYSVGRKWGSRPARCFAVTLVFIIAIDNTARYAYWYPFGHVDGAQYGREHVGWNRAGFVTFEVLPDLIGFLRGSEYEQGTLRVQVTDVCEYNDWVASLLEYEFERAGLDRLQLEYATESPPDLVLTSPLFVPHTEQGLRRSGHYRSIAQFSVKHLHVATLWAAADVKPNEWGR